MSVLFCNMNPEEYLWIPLTCLQYLILFQAKSSELSLNVVAQWSTWQARKIWIEGGANGKVLQKSGACPALRLIQPLKRIHILITYHTYIHTSHPHLFPQCLTLPIRHVMSRVMKLGCPALGSCAGIQKVLSSPSMAFSGPKGLPGLGV